jgi:hypothetical protein
MLDEETGVNKQDGGGKRRQYKFNNKTVQDM